NIYTPLAKTSPPPSSTVTVLYRPLPPVAQPDRHRASPHDPPDDLGGQLPGLEHRSREGGRHADRPRHTPRDRPTSRQCSVPAGTGAVVAILNRPEIHERSRVQAELGACAGLRQPNRAFRRELEQGEEALLHRRVRAG